MPTTINIVAIADRWGSANGGVNAFNTDFCTGLAAVLAPEVSLVCLTNSAVSAEQMQQARQLNVQLLSLPADLHSDADIKQLLPALLPNHALPAWWIGHDTITAPIAKRFQQATAAGKLAIFQHMDYAAYQVEKKQDGNSVNSMSSEQAANAQSADRLFGVGPLLTSAAKRLRNRADDGVHELIPGLAWVAPGHKADNLFQVITFGRMGQEDDRIKQGKLAAASVAIASKNITEIHCRTVWLKVIGFPSVDAEYKAQFEELRSLVNTHAGRNINIMPLRYTENRQELFDHLAQSHVSLMLSLHDGFGLAGWEAIASAVPLIVSIHSGLYHFLEREFLNGYVFGIDIKAPDADSFSEEDISAVAIALEKISARPEHYQERAEKLRDELFDRHFTWEAAGRTFCKACGIPTRNAEPTPLHPMAVSDSVLIEREILLKASDEELRKGFSAYQEKLHARYEKNGIRPGLLLSQIQSMRSHYTATTMSDASGRITPSSISTADYEQLIQQVKVLGEDFETLPTRLLERVRTEGMYFDSDARAGVDATKSIEYFPLPKSIQGSANADWGYQWETIGRLLKTMIAFLNFSPKQISDGYAENGWLLGKPIAQSTALFAWANRLEGEASSVDVFAIHPGKGNLLQIGKFVARNSKLRKPQWLRSSKGGWSLFATDGARLYQWNRSHSIPIADYPLEKGFIVSYLALSPLDTTNLYCVTSESNLVQLEQQRKLGRIARTTQLASDAKSGDLYGIAIHNKVAPGFLEMLSIQNLSDKKTSIFCLMATDKVSSPTLAGLPKMTDLLRQAGIGEFEQDDSLAFLLPVGNEPQHQVLRIDRVLLEHNSNQALAAVVIRGSESNRHHLVVLRLQRPSETPMVLSTDLRIFDAIVVERNRQVLLFTTLLPGGSTQHAIAVWQLDAQKNEFELMSLGHSTNTGDATDLHVDTTSVNSIRALYRYADYSQAKPTQALWQWTWPEETLTCIGELPPGCYEGESALFHF